MLCTKNGLRFVSFKEHPGRKLWVKLQEERYFPEKFCIGTCEYEPGYIVAAVRSQNALLLISRESRTVVGSIPNDSGDTTYFGMKPLGNGLIFIRDRKFISVVDPKKKKLLKLLAAPITMDMNRICSFDVALSEAFEPKPI